MYIFIFIHARVPDVYLTVRVCVYIYIYISIYIYIYIDIYIYICASITRMSLSNEFTRV